MKGNEHFKAQEYAQAIECYTRAMCYDDTNSILYTNRASAYFKQDKLEAAETDCNLALEIEPSSIKALTRRATIRYKKGQYRLVR